MLRLYLRFVLRLHLRFMLRLYLGLGLRRYLGPTAGLDGPGSRRRGWGLPGGSAGGTNSRMKFSRFGFTGRLGPGVHLARLGRDTRLNLPRFDLGARLDLTRLPLRLGRLPGLNRVAAAASGSAPTFWESEAWWPWRATP